MNAEGVPVTIPSEIAPLISAVKALFQHVRSKSPCFHDFGDRRQAYADLTVSIRGYDDTKEPEFRVYFGENCSFEAGNLLEFLFKCDGVGELAEREEFLKRNKLANLRREQQKLTYKAQDLAGEIEKLELDLQPKETTDVVAPETAEVAS